MFEISRYGVGSRTDVTTMAIFLIFFLPLITSTLGQSIASLPPCSISCFQAAVQETTCTVADYVCQCQPANYNIIKSSVTACLSESTCSTSDIQKIEAFGNSFCPNVLASAPASVVQASAAPTTASSSSHTLSTIAVSDFDASQPLSTAPAPVATSFGANTPGTNWKPIHDAESTANRGPALEAVAIISLCISAMVLAFRFFARWYTKSVRSTVQSISWDDWLAVVALIGTSGITATIILGTSHGMGKHLPVTTSIKDLEDLIKIIYAFVLIIIVVLGVLKLSILCLYVRMTPTPMHKRVCYVMMGFVIAHDITALVGSIFSCVPVSEYWDLTSHTIFRNPACMDYLSFEIFNSVWSAVEDVIIWMLPISVVWSLKVSVRRKLGLYFLLGVSLISVICAIARLTMTIIWLRSIDISWNYPLIPFLSNTEACVAIITSSIPAIQPLFRGSLKQQQQQQTDCATRRHKLDPSEREWGSEDSKTVVPSTIDEADEKVGRSRTLFSRLGLAPKSLKGFQLTSRRRLPEFKMQSGVITTGQRTELKDLEEDEYLDFVPGLAGEPIIRMK